MPQKALTFKWKCTNTQELCEERCLKASALDSHILVKHSNPSEVLWFQEEFPACPWKDKTENAAQLLMGRQGRM